MYPRQREEFAKGEGGILDGTGSGLLDVFSLGPRMLQGGASAIGGGDFLEETAKIGATPDQSGLEAFGEDFARDPTLMIPFGALAKPLKAGYQALKGGKAASQVAKAGATQALRQAEKEAMDQAYKFKGAGETAIPQLKRNIAKVEAEFQPKIAEAIVKEGKQAKSLGSKAAKLLPVAKESAKEMGIEAGVQAAEGNVTPEGLIAAGVMSGAGQGLGAGLQQLSKGALASKLKFAPRMQDRRYGADSDVILEEGLMPWSGGAQGILESVNDKLADINVIRSNEMSRSTKGAMPELNVDSPSSIPNQLQDAEASMVNYDQIFDDARKQADFAAARGQIDAKEYDKVIGYIEDTRGKLGMQTGGEPFIRDIAISEGTYNPDINEIIMGSAPQGMGPVKPISDESSAWFNRGKVNQHAQNLDPIEGRAVASALMYDASRKPINEFLGQSSGEYAKYLPLEEALNQAMPRLGNRSWTDFNLMQPLEELGHLTNLQRFLAIRRCYEVR